MVDLKVLDRLQKDFPRAMGYVILNEGVIVEVTDCNGLTIAELDSYDFHERYVPGYKKKESKC